jgi:hypothetical protein
LRETGLEDREVEKMSPNEDWRIKNMRKRKKTESSIEKIQPDPQITTGRVEEVLTSFVEERSMGVVKMNFLKTTFL